MFERVYDFPLYLFAVYGAGVNGVCAMLSKLEKGLDFLYRWNS